MTLAILFFLMYDDLQASQGLLPSHLIFFMRHLSHDAQRRSEFSLPSGRVDDSSWLIFYCVRRCRLNDLRGNTYFINSIVETWIFHSDHFLPDLLTVKKLQRVLRATGSDAERRPGEAPSFAGHEEREQRVVFRTLASRP